MEPINKPQLLIRLFKKQEINENEFKFLWKELGIQENIYEAVEESVKELDKEINRDAEEYFKHIINVFHLDDDHIQIADE